MIQLSVLRPGLISAELRWFWPDKCPDEVQRWYEAGHRSREGSAPVRVDRYIHQKGVENVGIKVRDDKEGKPPDVEVKGLISFIDVTVEHSTLRAELWCKWKAPATLGSVRGFVTEKMRRMRKFDAGGSYPTEIELGADEKPVSGAHLPDLGCNVELTTVRLPDRDKIWFTLCFEAFGDLRSAPEVLRSVIHEMNFRPPINGILQSYPVWLNTL